MSKSKQAFIPSGDMTFHTVEKDRQRLLKFCRTLEGPLTLDLRTVAHCDSAGLAFLIEAKRLAIEKNIECCIVGMNKTIHALAEFCGVDKMFTSS